MLSRSRLSIFLVAIALLLAALAASIVFLWGAYYAHWEGPFAARVAAASPIPAARVGARSIRLSRYLEDIHSVERFLSSEEARAGNLARPLSDEDRESTLERLIQEEALYELAGQRNITTSDDQKRAVLDELGVTSTSTEAFLAFINQNYGWDMAAFESHVVQPLLLTRLLTQSYAQDHGGDLTALETYLMERIQRDDVVRYIKF